jgi:hypothetical protein
MNDESRNKAQTTTASSSPRYGHDVTLEVTALRYSSALHDRGRRPGVL